MRAGFVAADDEALELLESAHGDEVVLESLIDRRLRGEPIAWIVGYATFCGLRVDVREGVYVPRWQSEPLARRATERLPENGIAIDVCTGSGAIAAVLRAQRPEARVVATDLDARAVDCATSNGVEAYAGDLFTPVPPNLDGTVDVIVGVVPYVPTPSLSLLPRGTFDFETTLSYDGGDEGVDILRRVVRESPKYLRPGGALLLELGGDEAQVLRRDFESHGFSDMVILRDDDGDVRGIEATLRP
jgi:release factor glutamine methyltransferase